VINTWAYHKAIIIVTIIIGLFLDAVFILTAFYNTAWKVPGVSFGAKLLLALLMMLLVLLILKVRQLVAVQSLLDTRTVPGCLGSKSCVYREECSKDIGNMS